MKHKFIAILPVLFLSYLAFAQNNNVCLVKYKEYKSNLGTYDYWFNQEKSISVKVPNNRAIYMRGFPVLIDGVMTTQTDTVKYNREFNEFIEDRKEDNIKKQPPVWMKYFNSDVVKMFYYSSNMNKKFIVVDTLEKMTNWEILNDTLTILGFKCQKATINYKQEIYTAWFTSQLPYTAGPDYFRGLPGLILKVSNAYGNNGYEAIEIHTPFKGATPVFNSDGMSITKSEYANIINEGKRKAMETLNNLMEQLKTPEGKQALINQYAKPAEIQKP